VHFLGVSAELIPKEGNEREHGPDSLSLSSSKHAMCWNPHPSVRRSKEEGEREGVGACAFSGLSGRSGSGGTPDRKACFASEAGDPARYSMIGIGDCNCLP